VDSGVTPTKASGTARPFTKIKTDPELPFKTVSAAIGIDLVPRQYRNWLELAKAVTFVRGKEFKKIF